MSAQLYQKPNSGGEAVFTFCTLRNGIVPVTAFHLFPGHIFTPSVMGNSISPSGERLLSCFYFLPFYFYYLRKEIEYVILNGQTWTYTHTQTHTTTGKVWESFCRFPSHSGGKKSCKITLTHSSVFTQTITVPFTNQCLAIIPDTTLAPKRHFLTQPQISIKVTARPHMVTCAVTYTAQKRLF